MGRCQVLPDEDPVLRPLGVGRGFQVPHVPLDEALRVAAARGAEELKTLREGHELEGSAMFGNVRKEISICQLI